MLSYITVAVIGASIGIAELVRRYPDAPIAALKNYATAIYAIVNSIASIATLLFLQEFSLIEWEGTTEGKKVLVEILVAGLGASAILRIGLSVQVAGGNLNVSLMTVLEPILRAADNEVDRARASERLSITKRLMVGLDVNDAFKDLPPLCLYMLQGLSETKQKELADEVKQLRDRPIQDNVKLVSLGLALLNTVGADVLEKSVNAFKEMGPGVAEVLEGDSDQESNDSEADESGTDNEQG